MTDLLKQLMKKPFNAIGYEIMRRGRNPWDTLLGLRNIPFRTIIDVGANRGQFAERVTVMFPHAQVYCFEPLPGPFADLKEWARYEDRRVQVFNLAKALSR